MAQKNFQGEQLLLPFECGDELENRHRIESALEEKWKHEAEEWIRKLNQEYLTKYGLSLKEYIKIYDTIPGKQWENEAHF